MAIPPDTEVIELSSDSERDDSAQEDEDVLELDDFSRNQLHAAIASVLAVHALLVGSILAHLDSLDEHIAGLSEAIVESELTRVRRLRADWSGSTPTPRLTAWPAAGCGTAAQPSESQGCSKTRNFYISPTLKNQSCSTRDGGA